MPTLSQRRQILALRGNRERDSLRHRQQRIAEEEDIDEEEAADDGAYGGRNHDEGDEDDDEEDESAREHERHRARKRKRQRAQHGDAARRAGNRYNDENEDENEDDDDGGDTDSDSVETQAVRQKRYHELLAKKFVRYALACEPRRLPIRRQAVKEQVLDNQGKHFRKVFPLAQGQLRDIFGMELVEWPVRDEATMTVRERRKALKTQKSTNLAAGTAAQAANDNSVSGPGNAATAAPAAAADRYVLVSTLSEAYRASIFTPLSSNPAAAGPIAPVPPAPDAAYLGFATLVVALLTLAGGSLVQSDLEKYLARLHGPRHGPVRADANMLGLPVAAAMGDHIEDDEGGSGPAGNAAGAQADGSVAGGTLQYLVRQGYVVRVVEASMAGEGLGPVGDGGGGAGSKVTWHVGPRGRLEIGPAEVAAVVRHIYSPAAAASESFERRLQLSLRGQGGGEVPQRGAQQPDGGGLRRQ